MHAEQNVRKSVADKYRPVAGRWGDERRIFVEAINDRAGRFYPKSGFIPLVGKTLIHFLSSTFD
ncbi:hypothetical protein F3J29_21405 [Enterobacter sp. Cy-643]|nr:hypothetical protein [Enterobacter sp. Cy-643]